jgi:hypothetical protein
LPRPAIHISIGDLYEEWREMAGKQRRRAAALAACGAAISSSGVALTRIPSGAHGVSMDLVAGVLFGVAMGLAIMAIVALRTGGKPGAC